MARSSHKYSLDSLRTERSESSLEIRQIKNEIKKVKLQLEQLKGKGVAENKIQVKDLYGQLKGLNNDLWHNKQLISFGILEEADVIVSTQTSCYDEALEKYLTGGKSVKGGKGADDEDDRNLSKFTIIPRQEISRENILRLCHPR